MRTVLKTIVILAFCSLALAEFSLAQMIKRDGPPTPFKLLSPPAGVATCSLTLEDGITVEGLGFSWEFAGKPSQDGAIRVVGLSSE